MMAARYTLRLPLIPAWFAEIELISASDLLALLTYHKKCSVAVEPLLANLSWVQSHYGSSSACSWLFPKLKKVNKNPPDVFGFNGSISAKPSPMTSPEWECDCARSYAAELKLWDALPFAWWATYMKETFAMLQDRPSGDNVRADVEKTIQKVRSAGCIICSARVKENMEEFSNLLAVKVEEATAKVRIWIYYATPSS